MSNYLLSKNILYKTKLTKDDVLNRLANNIEKESFFDFNFKKSKPYTSDVDGCKFKVRRVIN